jgi:hypothetical protein
MSARHLLHDLGIVAKVPTAVRLVIFLSYTAAVAAIVGIAEHKLSKAMANEPVPWVVALVALCTLSVSILVLQLSGRIEDLQLIRRMRFKYLPAGGTSKPAISAKMYDAARRVIEGASEDGTCTIIAVNSFHEKFDSVPDNGAHRRYFEALNAKLGKVHYLRIVQCAAREQLAANLSPEYRDHFARVIGLRDDVAAGDHPRRVQLDMVAPTYPAAFVIVRYNEGPTELIWQLNEYTGSTRENRPVFRPAGLLFVTDPDKRLVRYFEGWFNKLANSSTYRVTTNDLYVT